MPDFLDHDHLLLGLFAKLLIEASGNFVIVESIKVEVIFLEFLFCLRRVAASFEFFPCRTVLVSLVAVDAPILQAKPAELVPTIAT